MDTVLFYTPGACSLSCMIALEWLGQPYRLCRIEKEVRAGEVYRRVNPRGQVPALRVDGNTLIEANAILTHIADRRPSAGLLPVNGTWERDVANQWLAYLGSGFHPVFWPYFSPQRHVNDEALYPAVKQAAVTAITREMQRLNTHLADKDFILGPQRSLLDAYAQSMDRWANNIVDVPNNFPHVWRHQKLMAKDPAVRLGVSIERGDPASVDDLHEADNATTSDQVVAFQGHVALADIV